MIRFIHTADIHFGVENYGRTDSATGIHTRLLDFYNALNFCVDQAISNDVDFFLFAGDAYKTAHPSPTQQRLLCDCFLRLFRAGIPLVIVVGNHDNPLSFGKAHSLELFGQFPLDGFHVIAKPTALTLKTKRGPVQIVGIPWPSRTTLALTAVHMPSSTGDLSEYISTVVAKIISGFAEQLDPSLPAVLTGHLTVSSGIFSGSEKRAIFGNDPVLLPSQLLIEPFDYIALGHLHRHQNLSMQGQAPLVYAGSIERVDFGERKEEKGCCLVTIHDKNQTTYEFMRTPTRRMIQIDAHLESADSQTDQILALMAQQNLEEAIVKIVYHLPAGKKDRVDIAALQAACDSAHFVAGIMPVRTPEVRDRRVQLRVTMDLTQLLDTYFKQKPEWSEKRGSLIEKARALEAELEQEIADKTAI